MNYIKSISFLTSLFLYSFAQANVQSHFEQIRNDPSELYSFFKDMPKGGELHYHLSGGAYPEIMLELTSKDNYCLNTNNWTVSKNPSACKGVETKDLFNHPELYANTIRSWSMKDFVPGKESGHDHFFNSFYKFNAIVADHQPELLASVMQTAALQNEHYMEVMLLPDNAHSVSFGDMLKDTTSFSQKRKLLLANQDFQNNVNYTAVESNHILQQARKELGCDTNPEKKACQIKVKFLYYSLREQSLDNLFAQTLNAFEAVDQSIKSKGTLVGVNLVQPEDGIISLRDYRKQMQIYQYLHKMYPQVNIALHAGELTQEVVTPEDLDYHIHDALFTGQAQRIGHGVDIAQEHNAKNTLDYMAKHHKAVEINLISNLKILKVSGSNHPLNFYLEHDVPVVLSTDDEGILRTNLTQQYVEAVLSHGLDYYTLKQINRNALTYSFLPGNSIWADAEKALLTDDCQDLESKSCQQFIKTSEKAQLQWELEQKLHAFENKF
ncbi:adenosine deaminase [Legionella steigerwaltii]|uniref:adenosine deaminase n=1 Tax=Legionella steigerwaltii TaxID=460 RepID=A0A378L6R7_9GAMM|nr:adenosine deaminase [Legionella steigerwaltii]KTD77334.1 adenosine deaminase [Legionella steigerwaltii]STY22060.1 adenosine deaminase [Legionella steigerwaltii]